MNFFLNVYSVAFGFKKDNIGMRIKIRTTMQIKM